MTQPAAYVHLELSGTTRPVGLLWVGGNSARERATFEFDPTWLKDPLHYALGPALPPGPGPFFTIDGQTMFGAIGDSSPDRWGRKLINRLEAHRARAAGETPRTLREIDYLLGVSDIIRQGALRFSAAPTGQFLADRDRGTVPPLLSLGRLLAAAATLDKAPEAALDDEDALLALAPGSTLGGARPKASVYDRSGSLLIAKFPKEDDTIDAVKWEAVMLLLARDAGIDVPPSRVEPVGKRSVLLVERFDRVGVHRVPFLSAMSLLNGRDGESRSYVEIFDELRRVANVPAHEGERLWRRLAFNILGSNLDDHLRNHAVLYDGAGWTLSPAYDLNPTPSHIKARFLATPITIDGDNTASIELAVAAAHEFGLKPADAKRIAGDVARALARWQTKATALGIASSQMGVVESAFEQADARLARTW